MTGGWERSPGEAGEMTQLICEPACYPDEGPKHLLQTGAVLLIKPRETKIANPTKVRFATWERQLAAVLAGQKKKRTPQSEVRVLGPASR